MTISVTKPEVPEKPQDSEVVLSVKGVSKKFCRDLKKSLFYGVQDITSELLGIREKSDKLRKKEFWALKDVSFELRRGEALGLVGKNGSGKSTLLRIIAGLIRPDTGSVEIQGRVAPLIALGAGFNPILTGRENIYANMSILGLSKQEIDERFDAVVDFAEIEDAIDAPVQSYSSGMRARLGFACAIYVEPEILLIDEVLAVGDVSFRGKCYQKLSELNHQGISFILVSHNPEAIISICNQAVYFSKGFVIDYREADLIINRYERDLFLPEGVTQDIGRIVLPKKSATESTVTQITEVFFRDENNNVINSPICGNYAVFCIRCFSHRELNQVNVKLHIKSHGGSSILYLTNLNDKHPLYLKRGENEIELIMPNVGLIPGVYVATIGLMEGYYKTLDVIQSFSFVVDNSETNLNITKCQFYQPRDWSNKVL